MATTDCHCTTTTTTTAITTTTSSSNRRHPRCPAPRPYAKMWSRHPLDSRQERHDTPGICRLACPSSDRKLRAMLHELLLLQLLLLLLLLLLPLLLLRVPLRVQYWCWKASADTHTRFSPYWSSRGATVKVAVIPVLLTLSPRSLWRFHLQGRVGAWQSSASSSKDMARPTVSFKACDQRASVMCTSTYLQ